MFSAAVGAEPRIAIIIDDLGEQYAASHSAMKLPVPVAFAFLPNGGHTPGLARVAAERGHEVLLHMPMEPQNITPAAGSLLVNDSAEAIETALLAALERTPGAVGVNNHQGSRFTATPRAMDHFLAALARRGGLYFVDSRTTAGSMGYALARHHDIPTARRQVFLDNDASAEGVRAAWAELLAIARRNGQALAIGHPYPSTLALLQEELPRLRQAGLRLVPPSAMLVHPEIPTPTQTVQLPPVTTTAEAEATPQSPREVRASTTRPRPQPAATLQTHLPAH
jgi:polysaccharide deacetylase 2 family uncharacterized protein YibQ